MSQIWVGSSGGGGGGDVSTLTGNSGGAVSPDGSGNISVLGSGIITVTGNPGTNSLTITSSGSGNLTVTVVDTTPYTVLSTDQYLAVDARFSSITINLPNTTATGRTFVVKDYLGQAAINNIIITTPGGTVLFDGFTSYTMATTYQAVNLIFDSQNYQLY